MNHEPRISACILYCVPTAMVLWSAQVTDFLIRGHIRAGEKVQRFTISFDLQS